MSDRKIGLFGGTFNPVHLAHLRAAEEVRQYFLFDEIKFIPCAVPPHKTTHALADARDRLAMLRLAVADHREFTISEVELKRAGPSYTIDTLNYFRKRLRSRPSITLIIGLDAFFEIDTWKDCESILASTRIIVMTRDRSIPVRRLLEDNKQRAGAKTCFTEGDLISVQDYQVHENRQLTDEMLAFLRTRISPSYEVHHTGRFLQAKGMRVIHPYHPTRMDISSTAIRNMAARGYAIRYLVSDPVADYIHDKGLYHASAL